MAKGSGRCESASSIARSVAKAHEFNRTSPVTSTKPNFDLIYDAQALKQAVEDKFTEKYRGRGKIKHPNRKKRNIEKKLRQKQRKKLGTTGKYKDYMKSSGWKVRRELFISNHPHGTCEICCSSSSLVVHHHTYKRVGCELDEDLALLCNTCHGRLHFGSDGTRFELKERVLRDRYAEILAQEFVASSLTTML